MSTTPPHIGVTVPPIQINEAMATQKGVLHPVSQYVPQFGRVKKVFLAYVHNPDQYETFIPPYPPEQLFDQNILHLVQQQRLQHESQQASKILAHRACVKRLAEYLKSVGVAVSYDQHWEGQQISNQLQHYEQQIADSDFVLLIITPSVKYYLENDAPKEEEILFTEHFLYNLMTIKKPDGTNFIPVFLNKRKDVSLVPTSLASSTSYELIEPFDIHRGDMYDLYALLTNQKLSETTPLGPYRLPSKPSPCEFVRSCNYRYNLMYQIIFISQD